MLIGYLCAGLVAAVGAATSPPDVELIGRASIAGDAVDLSGLADVLSERTPHNRLGSFGSAIAYTGEGVRYIAANDRGPADGVSAFRARLQTFDISVIPGSALDSAIEVRLTGTILLSDMEERPLVGSIRPNADSRRYDAEGICLGRGGTIWIAEEYGPSIDEFAKDGRMVRRLELPSKLLPESTPADYTLEFPPHAKRGRFPNRGLEGLTITPDGKRLVGIMQGPLIQDGAVDAEDTRRGVYNRIVEIDTSSGAARELVYEMAGPDLGVSEILAMSDRRFLVLERDGKAGVKAKHRAVYVIDTGEATDVSGRESLPATGLAKDVRSVSKSLLLDLTDPRFGLAGPTMPEKFEGLAFGPDLADGRRLLIVTVDNDMKADVASMVYAFAVSPAALGQERPGAATVDQPNGR